MANIIKKDLATRTVEAVNNLQKDIASLNKKSGDALKTFKDTLDNLDKINTEIETKEAIVDSHIAEFQTLKNQLSTQKTENAKVGSKIREFLGQ